MVLSHLVLRVGLHPRPSPADTVTGVSDLQLAAPICARRCEQVGREGELPRAEQAIAEDGLPRPRAVGEVRARTSPAGRGRSLCASGQFDHGLPCKLPYKLPCNVPYKLPLMLLYKLPPGALRGAVRDLLRGVARGACRGALRGASSSGGMRRRRAWSRGPAAPTTSLRHPLGVRGEARPEDPPAFPHGDVLVLDVPQECTRLDAFGGEKPRGRRIGRRAPGGGRAGAQRAAHRAHGGSLPPGSRSICTARIDAGGVDTLVLLDRSCGAGQMPGARSARGVPVLILLVMHEVWAS